MKTFENHSLKVYGTVHGPLKYTDLMNHHHTNLGGVRNNPENFQPKITPPPMQKIIHRSGRSLYTEKKTNSEMH